MIKSHFSFKARIMVFGVDRIPESWLVCIENSQIKFNLFQLDKCGISDFGVVELFKKAKILWTELQVL